VAYYDQRNYTIQHVHCLWTLPTSASGPWCKICMQYRNVLCSSLHRENKSDSLCDPSSHTNLHWLSHPQKDQQIRNLQDVLHSKERKIQNFQAKLDKAIQDEGIQADTTTHNDCWQSWHLKIHHKRVQSLLLPFNASFGSNNIKQHPWRIGDKCVGIRLIRWCLYLHHRSSGCYSTLRNTGVISLPSEQTLRDYRHFAPSVCGFSTATDLQLLEQVQQQKPAHQAKYVGWVIDEMYVKEGLVFEKLTGSLVGQSDLGDVNNLLAAAEQQGV